MESSINPVKGGEAALLMRPTLVSPSLREESAPVEPRNLVSKPVPILEIEPAQRTQQIHEAVEKLNAQMESMRRDLGFSYDERLNREIVTVRKETTGEVVRQLPPEVVLRVAHSIEDLKGLLYDDIF